MFCDPLNVEKTSARFPSIGKMNKSQAKPKNFDRFAAKNQNGGKSERLVVFSNYRDDLQQLRASQVLSFPRPQARRTRLILSDKIST